MTVDRHPPDTRAKQFSHCWCPDCGKMVYMTWIAHGEKKECSGCNLFYGPDGVQLVSKGQLSAESKSHAKIKEQPTKQKKGKQDEKLEYMQSSF